MEIHDDFLRRNLSVKKYHEISFKKNFLSLCCIDNSFMSFYSIEVFDEVWNLSLKNIAKVTASLYSKMYNYRIYFCRMLLMCIDAVWKINNSTETRRKIVLRQISNTIFHKIHHKLPSFFSWNYYQIFTSVLIYINSLYLFQCTIHVHFSSKSRNYALSVQRVSVFVNTDILRKPY